MLFRSFAALQHNVAVRCYKKELQEQAQSFRRYSIQWNKWLMHIPDVPTGKPCSPWGSTSGGGPFTSARTCGCWREWCVHHYQLFAYSQSVVSDAYTCTWQAVLHSEEVVKKTALEVWRVRTRKTVQQLTREVRDACTLPGGLACC